MSERWQITDYQGFLWVEDFDTGQKIRLGLREEAAAMAERLAAHLGQKLVPIDAEVAPTGYEITRAERGDVMLIKEYSSKWSARVARGPDSGGHPTAQAAADAVSALQSEGEEGRE